MRKIAVLFMIMMLLVTGCGKGAADGTTESQTQSEATEAQAEGQDSTEALTETQEAVPTAAIDTIQTDSFSMDYCKFGSGERALIILPGLSIQSVMGSADAVAQAYQTLAQDYTIYLFDPPKELPDSYSVYEAAEDVAEALQALGLEKVSIFGASYGGMKAMLIAARHPEMVEKTIVVSTSANLTEEEFQTVENWISLAKQGNAEELYLVFGEAIYPSAVFEQARDLLVESAKAVTDADLVRFAILAETIEGFDVVDLLHRIECPVLVLGSKDDRALGGEASEQVAEKLKDKPGCELVMYEGYGHAAYDLAPDYRERLKTFFLKDTER